MPANPSQFAAAVLKGIGAPVTSQNIAGFIGWSKAEGPLGSSNWQRNNPLNTTDPSGASGSINSVGVRIYPTAQAGVAATVKTLTNGHYGGILNAFHQNNPHALAPAIGQSPWGTSGSLAAQTIAQTLGQHVAVPTGGGIGQAPAQPSAASVSLEVPKQVNQFDAQGFQQAQRRYELGQFLSNQKNPFDIGPKIPGMGANPLFSSGLLPTTAPNQADYMNATTVLQKVAGAPLANVHASAKGYVNPIPGAVIGRTDMGVDASLKPGSPIRAIGDSKVVGISPNWYKGQPYVLLQLLNGPQAGKRYYVSEQISPSVKPGQTVRAGQPIGTYAQSGTGIEIGWGSPTPGRTLAQATSGYSEGQVTPAGANFRSFLAHL